MSSFKDHFSSSAVGYASHRPVYPKALVDYLASLAPATEIAWDAGCGTGQLSVLLAERFTRVIAMDASIRMIEQAEQRDNIDYRCMRAEDSDLPDEHVDIAVSAQAVHWFDLSAYYNEVWRVTKPGGIIALISYELGTIDAKIDSVIKHFYSDVLGPYWPPERKLVEEGYRSLPFPFKEIETPAFEMLTDWSLDQLLGYIDTWSAVRGLERAQGREQFNTFKVEITHAWGTAEKNRTVRWPLAMRVGRL